MARPVRIDVEDQWYHVVARGQRREKLFLDEVDFRQYLKELQNALKRRHGILGAFCLMTNHVHLLIHRSVFNLAGILQLAHSRYGRHFNRRHRKHGYVFQGRYKAYLVLDDRYLASLLRYIHRNPVAAGMVRRCEDYRWSSDGYYRKGRVMKEIDVKRVPGFEGARGSDRYRKLVSEEEMDLPPVFKTFVGQAGMERELDRRKRGRPASRWRERRGIPDIEVRTEELARRGGQRMEKLRLRSKARGLSRVRQEIMAKLYEEGYPPAEIARIFGRTPSAVLHAYERF